MTRSKNVLSVAMVAAALALSGGVVPIAGAAGNASAAGGGTIDEGGGKSTFVFNAVQQKNGTVGHLVYHVRAWDLTIVMDLDCLDVAGHIATVGGIITATTYEIPGFIFVGQTAVFRAADNGQGANAEPDKISDLWMDSDPCTHPKYDTPEGDPYLPISGNIQIR